MTEFLFVVVLLLAIWIARGSSRARRLESLIAKLTSRIFLLEEDVKQLRKLIETEFAEPQPAPAAKHQVEQETPRVAPLPVQPPPLPVFEPATPRAEALAPVEAEPMRVPPPLPASSFEQPAFAQPAGFSFSRLLNLEEALGTNWLNKLGIVILVIGVALFLAHQMRELGPAGKVTTGYIVTAVMLGAGVFFERRHQWKMLARAGIAGGWSLLYFTTYAMYHVPATHVLSSESVDLALLLIVAAGMIAHTLRYESQLVTGLAFLLAFTTVNISRGDASSLIASAILGAGLAMIAVRRRWFEMEIAGMAAAYCNHYLWLRPIILSMHGHVHEFAGYTASSALLCSYWLIFRVSYVFRRIDDRRQEQVSTIAAVLNAALFVSVMGYQSVHPELSFQFLLGLGALEFLAGQLPVTRRRRAAFVVLTTLGTCFLVAAFPYRYSEASLSASWLAVAEALFLAGVFLREILFRRLGMLAALALWIQMIGGDAAKVLGDRMYDVREGGQPGLALLFGVAAAVFYANSHWISQRWPDLIQTGLERLCFRRLSHMATILAVTGAWIAWPDAWTAVAWAALGMLLTFAGRRWSVRELSIDGMACMAAVVVRALAVNLEATHTYPHAPWISERFITVAIVAALFYLGSRWAGLAGVLAVERISAAYTWVASGLGALLAWYELRSAAWPCAGLCWRWFYWKPA